MSASTGKLDLDPGVVAACREAATQIAAQVGERIAGQDDRVGRAHASRACWASTAPTSWTRRCRTCSSTTSQTAAARPGVAYWLGNAMLQTGLARRSRSPRAWTRGSSTCARCRARRRAPIRERVTRSARRGWRRSAARFDERRAMRERLGESPPPLRYVLTATGNVYEDVVHAWPWPRPAATSSR
jgi:beta-lysine 5,6-aminomutase alpha subunit